MTQERSILLHRPEVAETSFETQRKLKKNILAIKNKTSLSLNNMFKNIKHRGDTIRYSKYS
jgi:hypothetical protein